MIYYIINIYTFLIQIAYKLERDTEDVKEIYLIFEY